MKVIRLVATPLLALAATLVTHPARADGVGAPSGQSHAPAVDARRAIRAEQPPAALQAAVLAFKQVDPSVAVNYAFGHLDSFSAHPKNTVPDYALAVLQARGLPVQASAGEQLQVVTSAKGRLNLDVNLDRRMPEPYEGTAIAVGGTSEADDPPQGGGAVGQQYQRTKPAIGVEPDRPLWVGPPADVLAAEAQVAKPVLLGFLARHRDVFELGNDDLQTGLPGLQQTHYTVGRYARKAVFEQSQHGVPLIDAKVIVLFDRNWNVTAISRTIATPAKLRVAAASAVGSAEAVRLSLAAAEQRTQVTAASWKSAKPVLGIDPIRRARVWVVNVRNPKNVDQDLKVKLDAVSGAVLNVSDNVSRYTDAKVRRWGYSGGDLQAPSQYVESGFYTRDDNTLVHDFFNIVNDERGGGDPQSTCSDTSKDSMWYDKAYGTTAGSSYVRPTRRNDRDFSLWYPSGASGSFSESNSYYWARWFFQWVKGSISDLGELPASASDYPKVLIVTGACIKAGGSFSETFEVTTDGDVGEGLPVIRLPEKCRSSNGACAVDDYTGFGTFKTCEGNGCSTPPSVIDHEINHFLLKTVYGVGTNQECASSDERSYLHEGALGSAVPQAYWHHYYGVGYNPPVNYLYKADYDAGLVHADDATKRTVTDYPCDDAADPYNSGRVAGQVLWEIYHGEHVDGSTLTGMARPATDRDFLVLVYWAAELVEGSVTKDRKELANRVMEIMENYSTMSAADKQLWCDAWTHHELGDGIVSSYCN